MPKERQKPRQTLQNFSFAHPKQKPYPFGKAQAVTSSQRRSIAMWLDTVLQPHTQQFIHALKSTRQMKTIYQTISYIRQHYRHLQEIVCFYITAQLSDYGWIAENQNVQRKNCTVNVLLNLVIEEIAARHYRQSQWFNKFLHIPIYQVYRLFDPLLKGYTTLNELKEFVQTQLDKQIKQVSKKARKLVKKKLTTNLGGLERKIYQQNIQQLMQRVNLVVFTKCDSGQSHFACAYRQISQIMAHKKLAIQVQRQQKDYSQLIRSRKALQQLQLAKQNFIIKENAAEMMKSNICNIAQLGRRNDKKKQIKINCEKQNAQNNYSNDLAETQADYTRPKNPIVNMERERNNFGELNKEMNINDQIRKQVNNNIKYPSRQSNHDLLIIKQQILRQLSLIHQQKVKNHSSMFKYI